MVRIAVPAPRRAPGEPLPLRSPESCVRVICREGMGGLRVLHYSIQKCSVGCMTELTVRQAREMLTAWVADQHAVTGRRDEVVQAAVAAGLSKSEVHRLTGIARTTIDRIVSPAPAAGEGTPK